MKSRGILMTTVMVEALLRSTKTQTRRGRGLKKINESPNDWVYKWIDVKEDGLYAIFESTKGLPHLSIKCPYGFVEDQLWVRETFVYVTDPFATTQNALFWADGKTKRLPDGTFKEGQLVHNWESDPETWKKQPSLFMPRAASRFDLEIVNITCERLKDISERDAIAEGVEYIVEHDCQGYVNYLDENSLETPIESYRSLINLINGKGFWESNPWVWVITFKDITAKK